MFFFVKVTSYEMCERSVKSERVIKKNYLTLFGGLLSQWVKTTLLLSQVLKQVRVTHSLSPYTRRFMELY